MVRAILLNSLELRSKCSVYLQIPGSWADRWSRNILTFAQMLARFGLQKSILKLLLSCPEDPPEGIRWRLVTKKMQSIMLCPSLFLRVKAIHVYADLKI